MEALAPAGTAARASMATETERSCTSAALIDQPVADAQLNRSSYTEASALMCCLCRRSVVSNPVQLACLHNCCQSCAAKAAAEAEASDEPLSAVVRTGSDRNCVHAQLPPSLHCPLCSYRTPLDALVPNSFVAIQAQAARIHSASARHCDGCAIFCSSGSSPAPRAEAEWWCHACASFFCDSCLRLHASFSSEHSATSLTALRASDVAAEEAERAAAAAAARRCDAHGQPYDLLCLTCALPQCRLCPAACADRAHRLAPFDDRSAAEELVVRAIDELRRRLGEFRARAEAVAAEEAVQERATKTAAVARQRAECERQIDFNWATVESAIERAFDAARSDLLHEFEAAEASAQENRAEALSAFSGGRFDAAGAQAALAYATCLADCGDVASVLLQEERALTALREQSRKADQLIEAALVRESRRTSVATAISDGRASDLPDNLSELARSWIGEPNFAVLGRRRHYDNDYNDVAHGLSAKGHWPGLKKGADEGRSSWLALDCGDLDYRVLRFDGCVQPAAKAASNATSSACSTAATSVATPAEAVSTRSTNFRTSTDCFDVALMLDGRLLLAARNDGLLECTGDGSGTVLSTWRPRIPTDEYDCVTSVAISSAVIGSSGGGDRVLVVAGLLRSRCVALLIPPPPSPVSASQRPKQLSHRGGQLSGSDGWTEARRLGWPGSRPWHLAVHGDLMAVTDARNASGAGTVVTGPQLALVALSRSHVLLRKQLDYPAFGVAVTAAAVIAAANEPAAAGLGLGPRRYPIDCFSHSGELLWRCSLGERASSIVTPRLLSSAADAPPATMAVLYVAFAEVGKVIAISATDGRQLADVFVRDGNRSSSPLRLSLAEVGSSGGGGRPRRIVLASLANDNRTVTLRASVGAL